MLHYRVADEIFALNPGYLLGVLVFEGCDNTRLAPEARAWLREAEAQVRRQGAGAAGNVAEIPEVAAWREAYRRFGAKPAEHRSSIEAMLRRVLGAKDDAPALPSINPLVDIGNVMSLRHRLPVGVHPMGGEPVTIELRSARAGDRFLSAEGAEPESVPAGEIVLARGCDVLTRRWTWRQSVLTRTLPSTTRVFFNVDGLPPAGRDQVEAAMRDTCLAVGEVCGARLVASAVLDAGAPAFSCP